jgi:hypothetical protein
MARVHKHQQCPLKKQLTDAIELVYLQSQHDQHVGFANRSLGELFTYLFQAYGMLTPQTLVDNQTSMQQPWDTNTPFETLIKQIEDAMVVADAAAPQAYTDTQVLTLSYTLVYNTGLYFNECKTWNAKDAANKTWDNFKTFFLHTQAELRLQQQATSACAGFSNYVNNHENETSDALANLATAQASQSPSFLPTCHHQLRTCQAIEISPKRHHIFNKYHPQPPTTMPTL